MNAGFTRLEERTMRSEAGLRAQMSKGDQLVRAEMAF